jgi:hypothetical protein
MGRAITQKDENTIAVFSSIVDDFIFEGTIEEYKELLLEEYKRDLDLRFKNLKIDVYMTYEQACKHRDLMHKN